MSMCADRLLAGRILMMNRCRYGVKLDFFTVVMMTRDLHSNQVECMFEVCEGQVVHSHRRNKASGLKCTICNLVYMMSTHEKVQHDYLLLYIHVYTVPLLPLV